MLTIPGTLETAVTKAYSQPLFLLKIGFSPTPVFFSNAGQITWNSIVWAHRGFEIKKLNWTESYAQKGEIIFENVLLRPVRLCSRIGSRFTKIAPPLSKTPI